MSASCMPARQMGPNLASSVRRATSRRTITDSKRNRNGTWQALSGFGGSLIPIWNQRSHTPEHAPDQGTLSFLIRVIILMPSPHTVYSMCTE